MVKEYNYAKLGELQNDGTRNDELTILDKDGIEMKYVVEADAVNGWVKKLKEDPDNPGILLLGENGVIIELVEMKVRIIRK